MPRVAPILLVTVMIFAVTPPPCFADLDGAAKARVIAQIESDREQLDPGRLPDLNQTRQQVTIRIGQLEHYLETSTDQPNRDAWLDYLRLEPLRLAIESDQPAARIGSQAIAVRYRLIGTLEGLELAPFRNLREAVEHLIDALRFRDNERSIEAIGGQLDKLAERIAELDSAPNSSDIADISNIVGLLQSSGQASGTVTALRDVFQRPNVAIVVSESLVRQVIDRPVDRTNPVRDCILGTRIVGQARTMGQATSDVLPSTDSARLRIEMNGTVNSRSSGYNGPVRMRMLGFANVAMSRIVQFDASGIHLEPAMVDSQLRTEVPSISHPIRLVRKIARRRLNQDKQRADRIAGDHMRDRLTGQFTSQTDSAANLRPDGPLSSTEQMLQRLSLPVPIQAWSSAEDRMIVDATLRRSDQLATAVPRPAITEPFGLAIQLHESVINNALSPVLAGRTMSEAKLDELLSSAGIEPQSDSAEPADEPPFEIDFARSQPIVFEARDQRIRIGVRGTRFAQGRRELKRAMEISATYQAAADENGRIVLMRQPEVNVDFPGSSRLTVTQVSLRQTIKQKFDAVFPETMLHRSLEVPEDVSIESLRGRVFVPTSVNANNGWLTVALR